MEREEVRKGAVIRRRMRCNRAHCGGQYYLENHTEPVANPATYGEEWIGFEIKCLLCSRLHPAVPYISLMEMTYLWGQHPNVVRQARWNTLSFLWLAEKVTADVVRHRAILNAYEEAA